MKWFLALCFVLAVASVSDAQLLRRRAASNCANGQCAVPQAVQAQTPVLPAQAAVTFQPVQRLREVRPVQRVRALVGRMLRR